MAQRRKALGDALERLAGLERETHFAGGKPEIRAGVQLQRFGLGVAQALGDVVDRETRILQQPVGIQDSSGREEDRKSTRLNSSHTVISYAVFCLKKKKK